MHPLQLHNPLKYKAYGSVGLLAELHVRGSQFESSEDHHLPDLKNSSVKFVGFALISGKATSLRVLFRIFWMNFLCPSYFLVALFGITFRASLHLAVVKKFEKKKLKRKGYSGLSLSIWQDIVATILHVF